MMIHKRLIQTVSQSKKYVAANVALQWCALAANVVLMVSIAGLLADLLSGDAPERPLATAAVALAALAIRFVCTTGAARMGYLASRCVKKTLRELIYRKLLALGSSYTSRVKTSEVVQVAVEGVDQLETYFGAYLPQFFYAMLAPLTLFGVLCFVNVPVAGVLLVCVPLIPAAIAAVQTWAKKLLSRYWGRYTELGDTFLENLQGLTTLKIYQADDFKQQEMNRQAEEFRRITMKVLTMQLNSITIMDLIAYGGAGLGMILAVLQYRSGGVSLAGCLLILLLAGDFFIPMRQLGSFFHIAMNGMAACDRIFGLLDLPTGPEVRTLDFPKDQTIRCRGLTFSYELGHPVLEDVDLDFPQGSFTALVGESGCGKSTLAGLLMGRNRDAHDSITVGGIPLSRIREADLLRSITYVGHQSYLFAGTVRENLLMAAPEAQDARLWQVLEQVKLAGFLRTQQGLDTPLLPQGSNFSGGQRQRLALARALLHDSPIYIFDEATANIDVESENDILRQIHQLARHKTVVLISHRLAAVTAADTIYVLQQGRVVQQGTHQALLARDGTYRRLWDTQQALERYGKEAAV